MDFMKFAILLVISIAALIYVDTPAIRAIASVVGGVSIFMIFLVLIFGRRRL